MLWVCFSSIDFFFLSSVGLVLIRFCYGFLDYLSKCLFSQFQIFAFVLFFFFRLQKSLKILILVWVPLFLILTKSLGLYKYRIECCIDTYFRFSYQNTVEREIHCRNTRRTEKENNREREIHSKLLPELLPVSFSLCFSVYTLNQSRF